MFITQIQLQNTKSYSDQVISFAEGTNAICGENGAGKTTLLEAIGFTLFDFLPNTQSAFVREGEKTATITVSFIDSQDEREYQVVRRCGSSTDYYVYDPQLDAKLANGKADVLDWLREHLLVEANADLSLLFRDAIGVPQGLLTAAFLQTPGQRKPVFDRLLQVDEYVQANKELLATVNYVRDQIGDTRTVIAGFQAQADRLPGLELQKTGLEGQLFTLEKRLVTLQSELDQLGQRRQALEAVERQVADLTQQVTDRRTRHENVSERLVAAHRAVDASRQAQAEQESSEAGYRAYLAAEEAITQLEEQRLQRDRLLADRSQQEKSLTRSQTRVEQLTAESRSAQDAAGALQVLLPQVDHQEELETDRSQLQQQLQTLLQMTAQVTDLQQQRDRLLGELVQMEKGLDEAQQLEKELATAQKETDALRARRLEFTSRQATAQAELARLQQQDTSLQHAETATCPVCEQPLTADHRRDLLAQNQARQQTLADQVEQLAGQQAQLEDREKDFLQKIQSIGQRLRRLPRLADRETLQQRLEAAREKLADLTVQLEDEAGTRQHLAQVESELEKLDNPRRRADLLAAQAERSAELQEQLQAEQQAVAALNERLAEIEDQLAPFADLDDRIAGRRQALSQHAADHKRHLESSRLAAELPERQAEVEKLVTQQAELQRQLAEVEAQLETVSAGFDPQDLEQVRQDETRAGQEQAGLSGQKAALGRQLEAMVTDIDQLQQVTGQLQAQQERLARFQKLSDQVQYFRKVIRDAGPHVVRRLVQQVSLQATRLFGAIMADHTARLTWAEDYSIVMEKDGRSRAFEQLSGGEQMAAALAIRLALLRELSAIDVAFFDEPTSNLDDIRRENLAEQIMAIKDSGFSQLFVISHDDTFEQATNRIVRVYKEDGESRVELG